MRLSKSSDKGDSKKTAASEKDDFLQPDVEPPSIRSLFKTFTKLAVPNIVTNFCMMIGEMIALIFAGHSGDSSNLAVMGLAHSTMNILVMSVMVGVNAAQETLTSQAFGAGKIRLCGMYLNRGQAILTFFFTLFAGLIAVFGE